MAEPPPPLPQCCICCAEDDIRQIGCGHYNCRDCLRQSTEVTLMYREFWPPKCCSSGHFTDEDVAWVQSSELLEKFREVVRERSIGKPIYCSEKQCSVMLDANKCVEGTSMVLCGKCNTLTCTKCKQSHDVAETDCEEPPPDPDLNKLLQDNTWSKCTRCGQAVSKNGGCNEIRCACGHKFCYVCGSTWKSCECDFLDDEQMEALQQANDFIVKLVTNRKENKVPRQEDQQDDGIPSTSVKSLFFAPWTPRLPNDRPSMYYSSRRQLSSSKNAIPQHSPRPIQNPLMPRLHQSFTTGRSTEINPTRDHRTSEHRRRRKVTILTPLRTKPYNIKRRSESDPTRPPRPSPKFKGKFAGSDSLPTGGKTSPLLRDKPGAPGQEHGKTRSPTARGGHFQQSTRSQAPATSPPGHNSSSRIIAHATTAMGDLRLMTAMEVDTETETETQARNELPRHGRSHSHPPPTRHSSPSEPSKSDPFEHDSV